MISHRSVSYRCYSLLAPDPPTLQRFLRASPNSFHISEHRQLLRFKTFSSRKTVLHKCSENMLNLKNQLIRGGFKTALVSTRKSPPTLTDGIAKGHCLSCGSRSQGVTWPIQGMGFTLGIRWWLVVEKNQHTALDFNIFPQYTQYHKITCN